MIWRSISNQTWWRGGACMCGRGLQPLSVSICVLVEQRGLEALSPRWNTEPWLQSRIISIFHGACSQKRFALMLDIFSASAQPCDAEQRGLMKDQEKTPELCSDLQVKGGGGGVQVWRLHQLGCTHETRPSLNTFALLFMQTRTNQKIWGRKSSDVFKVELLVYWTRTRIFLYQNLNKSYKLLQHPSASSCYHGDFDPVLFTSEPGYYWPAAMETFVYMTIHIK